jgi:hypothetical protein
MKKFILFALIMFLSSCGCATYQCKPDRKNYDCIECYNVADCFYRNKANKDKSICVDDQKERRVKHRYEYCKDEKNRPPGVDFEKCMYIRNQK